MPLDRVWDSPVSVCLARQNLPSNGQRLPGDPAKGADEPIELKAFFPHGSLARLSLGDAGAKESTP